MDAQHVPEPAAEPQTLSKEQVSQLKVEIKLRGKEFHIDFASWYYTEGDFSDNLIAGTRWLDRIEAGKQIKPRRMAAIVLALKLSIEAIESTILNQRDFFTKHYGTLFEEGIKQRLLINDKRGETAATVPSDASPTKPSQKIKESVLGGESPAIFKEFFGPAMTDAEKHVQLVFPMRKLKVSPEAAEQPPFDLEKNDATFRFLSKDGSEHTNVHPEGVSGYLAFEDVKAATHVANFVNDATTKTVWIRHENSRALDQVAHTCTFVFGLGFTAATREAATKRFEGKLFSIYCAKAQGKSFLTDYFSLKREVVDSTGQEKSVLEDVLPSPGRDVALIVRIVPPIGSSNKETAQPYFICAGRTALGTAVAAHFVTRKWFSLAALYIKGNKSFASDSLAAVVEHNAVEPSDEGYGAPSHDEDGSALHNWDGPNKIGCFAWA